MNVASGEARKIDDDGWYWNYERILQSLRKVVYWTILSYSMTARCVCVCE